MSGLNAKVVFVTGSSRGIGAAIARAFAKHGDIEREGGIAVQVPGDVTKFAEIEAMRHRIEETLGPIDILVANAGGSFTMPGPVEEISREGWHASIDGNLTATFLTIKSFLPGMKERKAGSVITISP